MIDIIKNKEKRTIISLVISLPALIISFFQLVNLPFDLAWIAIILCGIPILKEAAVGLITEFDIKADVLVSLALIASVIIGEIFAAGEVAFIMALGAYLEDRTVAKARRGIEKLVMLTPATARIVENGQEKTVPADQVKKGDVLRVLAGETIVVDGVIIQGNTSIDQSVMTGESMPVDKVEGDEVFSGTVNQFGTFDMEAVKVGEDSSLQRMIRLVESADADKAKIVGMADRWATWIVVIALVSAAGTWFVTGEIIRSVTILVVFCPCALVLATPTAIMAGIGNAAKYGILIREGDALERLAQVRKIAFDKTGTLTYGTPEVIACKSSLQELSDEEVLEMAASAELRSEHPLGKAITSHFRKEKKRNPSESETFQLIQGKGVLAQIAGEEIYAGNREFIAEKSISIPEKFVQETGPYIRKGCTIIFLAKGSIFAGYLVLADTVRKQIQNTIQSVHKSGVSSVLITGDVESAAKNIAEAAGISTVHCECLPEDKLNLIREWQQEEEHICMVGDGINDAPALKAAHVGIAMGGIGSDIAIDAADITLVSDDIKEIPHLIRLAKRTMATIKVNLAASMILNFAAIVLAMTGILTPILGALVHNAGSVAVIINSSLLLKWKHS